MLRRNSHWRWAACCRRRNRHKPRIGNGYLRRTGLISLPRWPARSDASLKHQFARVHCRSSQRGHCITTPSPPARLSILEGRPMSHAYKLNDHVRHQPQRAQGRAELDPPMAYTIVQRMPIEADGRLRYRIRSKSENIERVVTEDQLSYLQ